MMWQVAKGLATFVPGVYRVFSRKRAGAVMPARYFYSVWLRHLSMAHEVGLSTNPRVVAELGPGNSLGVGLAALLSGSDEYYAMDVARFAPTQRNLTVFDELVELFTNRSAIPDAEAFPAILPRLKSYRFPDHILTKDRLDAALHPERRQLVRKSIQNTDASDSPIRYLVPWQTSDTPEEGRVDMVLSQAVLEHVNEPGLAYRRMFSWLKPGGFMSHTIDFQCHRTARVWNGHWTYSDLTWKLIRGRRPFLINRLTHSRHLEIMNEAGFNMIADVTYSLPSTIDRSDLAPRFSGMPQDDLVTSGAFVQASKT